MVFLKRNNSSLLVLFSSAGWRRFVDEKQRRMAVRLRYDLSITKHIQTHTPPAVVMYVPSSLWEGSRGRLPRQLDRAIMEGGRRGKSYSIL